MAVAVELAPVREPALDPEKSYELVNGQVEEKEMAGGKHGVIAMNLGSEIRNYLKVSKRGVVCGEVHFKIGRNERIPDVAFVSAERVPVGGMPEGVTPFPPDLAIEVVSPNDVHDKLAEKVLEYLDGGVQQVWLVSLKLQLITIFRSPTEVQVFAGDRDLVCEDLLPAFRCSLKEIFQTGLPD